MIIIKFLGGLGNQMFQYAFYKNLKNQKKNKCIKADISDFENYNLHNGYELDKVFGIDIDIVEENKLKNIKDISYTPEKYYLSKIRRKIFGRKKTHIFENEFKWDYLDKYKNIYLAGYWQSEKYFKDNSDIIRKEFEFDVKLDNNNQNILREINKTNSVSIHIRQGMDYIKSNNHIILSKKYYEKALDTIRKKIKDPMFFIFSDSPKWVSKNINCKNKYIVDYNTGENSYLDMFLMKKCRHNIIANSTFSWWGAYLNNNEDKIVIAPEYWHSNSKKNIRKKKEIIPNQWLKIKKK